MGQEMELWKGNEALAEAAVRAGCRYYFGYPITPQNEVSEYLTWRLPEVGGAYVQAESEVAAINMVYGAGACGVRVMTSSSGPGISLMQEGISYLAGAQIPAVIVNMVRGGPGLGSIQPAQSDYYQATRGGGHGDYRTPVLAPASIQEAVDMVGKAFELADRYRNPVLIIGDGLIGQMMEPVVLPEPVDLERLPPKPWAAVGAVGREPNRISSNFFSAEECEVRNRVLDAKYRDMVEKLQAAEILWPGSDYYVVAYGTTARICQAAIEDARAAGLSVGLIRPIFLYPFPDRFFDKVFGGAAVKGVLTVEMSMGQMVDDVRLAVKERCPVHFYGRAGGVVPNQEEILAAIVKMAKGGRQ